MVPNYDEISIPIFGGGHDFFRHNALSQNFVTWNIVGTIANETKKRLRTLMQLFPGPWVNESHLIRRHERAGKDVHKSDNAPHLSGQADGRVGCTESGLAIIDRHQNPFE